MKNIRSINRSSKDSSHTFKGQQTSSLVAYHLFQVKKHYFVFDTTACRFYSINKIIYDFLKISYTKGIDGAYKTLLHTGKYSEDKLSRIMAEISLVAENGLFDTPATYINIADVEKALAKADLNGQLEDVQLVLTANCNLSCKYCYCSKNKCIDINKMMNKSVAKDAIDLLVKQNINSVAVTLFGGEPLLNKPLIDFIIKYTDKQSKLTKKYFNHIITTNATLLDDKMINYIVNYNFGLMVSLDGPQKLHDKQCPTKTGQGSFELAAKNIKRLMKQRTVGVRATMIHPMPNLKELVDFFIQFGFHNMVIAAATNRKEASSEYDFTRKDMQEYIKQGEKFLPWILQYLLSGKKPPYFIYERWYNQITSGKISPNFFLFNCGAGRSVVGVDTDGKLYPCAKFSGLKNWSIGNAKTGIDISKTKDMWLHFLHCIAPICGTCWAYPVCGGPCIWECAKNDGSFAFDDKYCNFMKRAVECSAFLSSQVQLHTDNSEDNCNY